MKTIGELIKEELEKQERSVTWFARKLSCDRSNVYRLFHKHSIETDLLIRISIILNRDFSSEISSIIHQKQQSRNQQQK
ncbi:MAG: XRE family transcriptional regulator [Muribaculaceae bacterium]|nr:XRE family transcriptional regulator [Muribaculaceae bacterium]